MTDEEKAEEKYQEHINKESCYVSKPDEKIYTDGFLDGLAEGRKDGYEQGKNNERELQCGKKNYEKDISKLKKENAELKEQIDKIKCCGNCIHSYKEKYDGLCCDLFDGEKYVPSIEKRDCDKWELSEGK